jgi:hypothetical protein
MQNNSDVADNLTRSKKIKNTIIGDDEKYRHSSLVMIENAIKKLYERIKYTLAIQTRYKLHF